MTWSMFAINYLDLDDSIKADQHFRNGYQRYLQPPFLIWREVAKDTKGERRNTDPQRDEAADMSCGCCPVASTAGADKVSHNNDIGNNKQEETGAVNFLTGAGGFLQSILFGYAGLRVLNDRLLINEPHLMPGTNELAINGFKYRGLSIDLIVKEDRYRDRLSYSLRFRECHGARRTIRIMVNDTEIIADCRHKHRSQWCKYDHMVHGAEYYDCAPPGERDLIG